MIELHRGDDVPASIDRMVHKFGVNEIDRVAHASGGYDPGTAKEPPAPPAAKCPAVGEQDHERHQGKEAILHAHHRPKRRPAEQ